MHDIFNSTRCFASNSLRDLLDARDDFHFQLMNKDNVVATAIGYYRIRKSDPWPTKDEPDKAGIKYRSDARTLENSEVRPYSWPAVLVFVNEWLTDEQVFAQDPSSFIPKMICTRDNRKIPVCVILSPVERVVDDAVDEATLDFPRNLISGGFPLIIDSQNERRIASVGCLVTDGHTTYALTNKHVAGEEGTTIYSKLAGEYMPIATTSSISVGRLAFDVAYQNWTSRNTYINMDIGLVELNDLQMWKTEVYKVGTMGRLADLHTGNFNLNLIGAKVAGYGSVSGSIEGEIQALFYRYKSVGGYEYLSDFLIGPSGDNEFKLHSGDSGTVMMYRKEDEHGNTVELMPIAVLWGQHRILDNSNVKAHPYALANCLSLVLNYLGVDLLRGWNIDQPYIWGKVGHYAIGSLATDYVMDEHLKELMKANLTNISFEADDITADLAKKDNPALGKDPTTGFCPLADVPDIIWKQSKEYTSKEGKAMGFLWGRKGDENPNHYADADYPTEEGNLYALCNSSNKLTIEVWTHYYEMVAKGLGQKDDDNARARWGILCFRVWQIFDYMVEAAAANDKARFIFGGGVLAHYIGDACQPLHSSYMADGDPADTRTETYTPPRGGSKHPKGVPYERPYNPGSGVHVAYEDTMIDKNIHLIGPALTKRMKASAAKDFKGIDTPVITSGQEAGFAVLQLMKATQEDIHPKDIVEAFKAAKSAGDDVATELYAQFGEPTITCMERGAQVLAAVWDAAWAMPGNKIRTYTKVKELKLQELYQDPQELPSMHLTTIDAVLKK